MMSTGVTLPLSGNASLVARTSSSRFNISSLHAFASSGGRTSSRECILSCTRQRRRPVPRHQRALVCLAVAKEGDEEAENENEKKSPEEAGASDSSSSKGIQDGEGKESADADDGMVSSAEFRQRMESLVETQGKDEAFFDGKALAEIIFKKYSRSYDVTFMRQEFMGKKLLAMNVMWKYREQKSFPLTEEEYLCRLDQVAETLRFWGAVGLVRQSLAATKERPRIGKAVSIRIDLDETGERAREWINR